MVTTVRKPTSARRREIARAALTIIGERGLRSLRTAALAEELGLSTGALFRHFASLDEILAEAARDAILRIEETFPDEALPPRDRILALARNRIALLRPDPGLAWILRSEQSLLVLPPDGVESLRDLGARTRSFLLGALRDGAADGSIRTDIEPGILLIPILGTIHTLIGSRGAARGEPPADPDPTLRGLLRLLEPVQGDPS